jgi:hypothetical protein
LTRAFVDGVRRVLRAPALLAGVYLITLLTAIPLAIVLHGAIEGHLGSSVAAETAAQGVNWMWWEEFRSQATGVSSTFGPQILGFAAVLTNVSDILDGSTPDGAIGLAVIAYLVAWTFFVGGVIDRLARQRRLSSVGFFAACGTYFFRFCRLAVLAGAAYWVLFGPVHDWILGDLYELATRGLTVERTSFLIRIVLYAVFGLLVLPVNLVVDYAKIRAVVEDRRSMVGAVLAAIRFIRRRPLPAVGLYALNAGVFVAVLAVYAVAAPGVGPTLWLTFVVGQAYVVARVFAKLVFYASQTSYFQSQLAHAEYVAAPRPVWPDSPAAEAISGTTT